MTDNRQPPVAVVLVNYRGADETIECIDSVLAQEYPDFHIFVVDNSSADGSLDRISRWCANPRRSATWRHFDGVHRVSDASSPTPIRFRRSHRSDGALGYTPFDVRLTLLES